MKDLISVIVPVYNLEKYLRESLDSIINQSYENLEIILVDDGSSDRSLEILKEYERLDSRVVVITQKNSGISEAMRNGFLISRGQYIARGDGDDINEPRRYERQLKFLKEGEFDLVGCYLKSFGDGSESYKRAMEGLNSEIRDYGEQFFRIYSNKCINGGALFGSREAFSRLMPFRREFSVVEDRLIYLSFHRAGYRIGNLPEVLYNYRVHKSNTSLAPKNAFDMAYRHFELMFTYLFDDVVLGFENVFIVGESGILDMIGGVFSRYYSHVNYRLVDEDGYERFLDEIGEYDSSKSVVFSRVFFAKELEKALKRFGYRHLYNLFLVI